MCCTAWPRSSWSSDDIDAAKELLSDALRLARAARCRRMEAQVLYRIGEAHLLAGEPAEPSSAFELALAVIRDLGDLIGEAYVLRGVGRR